MFCLLESNSMSVLQYVLVQSFLCYQCCGVGAARSRVFFAWRLTLLFADDTTLLLSHDDLKTLVKVVNAVLRE